MSIVQLPSIKNKISALAVIAISCLALGLALHIGVRAAPYEVWVSPDYDESTPGWGITHFSTIQDGVDAVSSGGTVNVGAATYYERVVIEKSLSLEGEDAETVVLDADNLGSCIRVSNTSDVAVSGMALTGSRLGMEEYEYPAASLEGSSSVTIADSIILGVGIRLIDSHNNTIINSLIDSQAPIMLFGSRHNRIEGNQIQVRHPQGVGLYNGSNGNVVSKNTIIGTDLEPG